MKHLAIPTFIALILTVSTMGQRIYTPSTENPDKDFENIYSSLIFSDSLTSSFLIIVKKEVKLHKHVNHSEHVYVLDGSGDMILGEDNISITKGDLIIIPKNTIHSLIVTSVDPVRILSFQSPEFSGNDRVYVE
jgi:mannose-6-phosphate isomerase-like protein (cupin superfamily)